MTLENGRDEPEPATREARRPSVVRNTATLASALPFTYMVGILSTALLARHLGPSGLGIVQLTIAYGAYFLIASDLGLTVLGSRAVAMDPASSRDWVDRVVSLRGTLAVGSSVAMILGVALLWNRDSALAQAMAIYALMPLLAATSLRWYFLGRERMSVAAGADALAAIVGLGFIVAFVHSPADTLPAVTSTVAATALAAALVGLAYRRSASRWPRFRPSTMATTLVMALPLGLSAVLISVYYNLDILIIGVIRSNAEVGYYGGAYRLILAILGLVSAFFAALLPALARERRAGPQAFYRTFAFAIRLTTWFGVALAIAAPQVAPELIVAVLGSAFAPAGTAFTILVAMVGLIAISGTYATSIIASGGERTYLAAVALAATTNVVLNVLLIPPYGIEGAAVATVAAEAAVFLVLIARIDPRLRWMLPKAIRRPLVAAAGMTVALQLTTGLPVAVRITAGGIIVLAAAFVLDRRLLSDTEGFLKSKTNGR